MIELPQISRDKRRPESNLSGGNNIVLSSVIFKSEKSTNNDANKTRTLIRLLKLDNSVDFKRTQDKGFKSRMRKQEATKILPAKLKDFKKEKF